MEGPHQEIISKMITLLGPPRTKKGVLVLSEEWAGDWKLLLYSHSDGDFSIAAYNHKLGASGFNGNKMLTSRKTKYSATLCLESLLPALRKATLLQDLASI